MGLEAPESELSVALNRSDLAESSPGTRIVAAAIIKFSPVSDLIQPASTVNAPIFQAPSDWPRLEDACIHKDLLIQ